MTTSSGARKQGASRQGLGTTHHRSSHCIIRRSTGSTGLRGSSTPEATEATEVEGLLLQSCSDQGSNGELGLVFWRLCSPRPEPKVPWWLGMTTSVRAPSWLQTPKATLSSAHRRPAQYHSRKEGGAEKKVGIGSSHTKKNSRERELAARIMLNSSSFWRRVYTRPRRKPAQTRRFALSKQ